MLIEASKLKAGVTVTTTSILLDMNIEFLRLAEKLKKRTMEAITPINKVVPEI